MITWHGNCAGDVLPGCAVKCIGGI